MNVVVAFSKIENGKSIKSILKKSGYQVDAVCTTGGQALQNANSLEGGILVCGHRFADMMCSEIKTYLSPDFEILLVGTPTNSMERDISDVVCLSMPLKVHELLQTMEMMTYSYESKRKKRRLKPKERTEEEKKLLSEAKKLLIERNHMTEEEAHRYIQKSSMDSGTGLTETAQMILSVMAG